MNLKSIKKLIYENKTYIIYMEIDPDVRKSTQKRIGKIFDKKISKVIENSIKNFSEEYTMVNETPFLLNQIYSSKSDELIQQFQESKLLIKKIKDKKIDLKKIAFLKVEELHPEKYQKILKKKNIEETKKNNKKTTSAYKCAKCGERKTTVEEKQMRRGDEPATVIVECVVCGHSWTVG